MLDERDWLLGDSKCHPWCSIQWWAMQVRHRHELLPDLRYVTVLRFGHLEYYLRKETTLFCSSVKVLGGEARSITTARSSLNESTTVPMSARSVSFKEPVVYETYDPPSSQSLATTTIRAANANSALEKLGKLFSRWPIFNLYALLSLAPSGRISA